jgi:hypothetical protein
MINAVNKREPTYNICVTSLRAAAELFSSISIKAVHSRISHILQTSTDTKKTKKIRAEISCGMFFLRYITSSIIDTIIAIKGVRISIN